MTSLKCKLVNPSTSCPENTTIIDNLLLSVPVVLKKFITPPTTVSPYIICLGFIAPLVVAFVPKLALFASIPLEVIMPIPADISVVANVMIATVASDGKATAKAAGNKAPPVATTATAIAVAIIAVFIALAIYTPTSQCKFCRFYSYAIIRRT